MSNTDLSPAELHARSVRATLRSIESISYHLQTETLKISAEALKVNEALKQGHRHEGFYVGSSGPFGYQRPAEIANLAARLSTLLETAMLLAIPEADLVEAMKGAW